MLMQQCVGWATAILGGSWDLVSKVISTLTGVISIVTLIITPVTKSHDPLSTGPGESCKSVHLVEILKLLKLISSLIQGRDTS